MLTSLPPSPGRFWLPALLLLALAAACGAPGAGSDVDGGEGNADDGDSWDDVADSMDADADGNAPGDDCGQDDDCATGLRCISGACVAEDRICPPGGARCISERTGGVWRQEVRGTHEERCSDDGLEVVRTTCDVYCYDQWLDAMSDESGKSHDRQDPWDGEYWNNEERFTAGCRTHGGNPECEVDERRCTWSRYIDALVTQDCVAGLWVDSQECHWRNVCEDGQCVMPVCRPEARICVGNTRLECGDSGEMVVHEECEGACVDGACEERVCMPGTARCTDDAQIQHCSAAGTAWGSGEDCADETSCRDGACVPESCTPGESLCAGDLLLECIDQDGVPVLTETDCAAQDEHCTLDDDDATCTPPVCAPGETRCTSASTVAWCDGRGTAWIDAPCVDGVSCREGLCEFLTDAQ